MGSNFGKQCPKQFQYAWCFKWLINSLKIGKLSFNRDLHFTCWEFLNRSTQRKMHSNTMTVQFHQQPRHHGLQMTARKMNISLQKITVEPMDSQKFQGNLILYSSVWNVVIYRVCDGSGENYIKVSCCWGRIQKNLTRCLGKTLFFLCFQ